MKYSIHRRRIVAAAAAAMAAGFVRFPEVARSATPKEKVIGITTKRFEFNPSVITIKKGEPVTLEFTALDVVMGFKLPDFGVRTDVIPGKTTRLRLTPEKTAAVGFPPTAKTRRPKTVLCRTSASTEARARKMTIGVAMPNTLPRPKKANQVCS